VLVQAQVLQKEGLVVVEKRKIRGQDHNTGWPVWLFLWVPPWSQLAGFQIPIPSLTDPLSLANLGKPLPGLQHAMPLLGKGVGGFRTHSHLPRVLVDRQYTMQLHPLHQPAPIMTHCPTVTGQIFRWLGL
jgi:hypothetical protein